MPKYLARVELHDAIYLDYDYLHGQMEVNGFARKVQGTSGTWYQLPPAEYITETHLTCSQVRDLVRRIANLTERENAVLVARYTELAWSGLEKTTAPSSKVGTLH